jgi:hypothetical protein
MTKLQTWNEAQAIIEDLGLSKAKKDAAIAAFEALLAPKKAGGNRPAPIFKDGEEYRYCRFTGLYFPLSEMVFQNDEARAAGKDKGYSAIGISLWNKGQKYLKDLKMKSVEIAYGEDQSDEMLIKGREMHQEAVQLEKANSMNNYVYLMEHFLSEEQADYLQGLDLPTA